MSGRVYRAQSANSAHRSSNSRWPLLPPSSPHSGVPFLVLQATARWPIARAKSASRAGWQRSGRRPPPTSGNGMWCTALWGVCSGPFGSEILTDFSLNGCRHPRQPRLSQPHPHAVCFIIIRSVVVCRRSHCCSCDPLIPRASWGAERALRSAQCAPVLTCLYPPHCCEARCLPF